MHGLLGVDCGIVLWDGTTVPPNWPSDRLALVIADEGAIAGLLRDKNDAIPNLLASRRLDIRNGTLFDLARLKPKRRTREIRAGLDKWLMFTTLARFYFLPRGYWPLSDQPEEAPSSGSAEENKQNIAYHYDVSNKFYSLFLDKEMVYTCAYAKDWDNNDIDTMQRDKLELVCRKLRLKPGDRLLDIGCGWGALSCYAAQNYGVTAYGVTLSEQQVSYAQDKVKRLGLEGKVRIELKDYSQVDGEFDKVASIGMQEHVGMDNYPTYYRTVHRVLKRGGLFLHHALVLRGRRDHKTFLKKQRNMLWMLTKYIFPGGQLDYIGNTVTMLERFDFEVHDVESLRYHYHITCKHWHDRLLANYDAAVAEVGEVKTRLWLAYLAASTIGFDWNVVSLYQTLASKRKRGRPDLPPTRADLYR